MDSIYIKFQPISINYPPALLHMSDIHPIFCNFAPGLQESPMRPPGVRSKMSNERQHPRPSSG